jgi:hypothetical protein
MGMRSRLLLRKFTRLGTGEMRSWTDWGRGPYCGGVIGRLDALFDMSCVCVCVCMCVGKGRCDFMG